MLNICGLRIRVWGMFICDIIIELSTALKCQKQLLMSSISNLGSRESPEIALTLSLFKAQKRVLVLVLNLHIVHQSQQDRK